MQTDVQQPAAQPAATMQQQATMQYQASVPHQAAMQHPMQQKVVQQPPPPAAKPLLELRKPLAEKSKNFDQNVPVKKMVKRSQTQRLGKKDSGLERSKIKRTKSFKRVRKLSSSEESQSDSPAKIFN